jgi:hypothetical protein
MSDQPATHDRRDFLRKAGVGAAVAGGAWVVPEIITAPAGAAPITWWVEIDPTDCSAVLTTSSSIGCDPAGWAPAQTPPTNGIDLNWTIVENAGPGDCTLGFTFTISDLITTIVAAEAEETCAASSPPGESRCVTGTIDGPMTGVSFPDNFTPEQCTYDVFRIVIVQGS